ncbi:tRNA dihydrouridine synthase [Ideonella margarita]|uniref:tRNA-dihydrouridine(16) synthase n=1 Tax=Ideonella margarita TaxID=2984191 RepID=A0ABU9CBF7_9BURK
MTLLLAPMEGLLDHSLRDALTQVGGIDRCVSEFIRITDMLLPERVFFRIVPELAQGGRTDAGVPVRPQLLGSDPACLADNAARVAGLGPDGVDLNFGCPAKVVNRHGGGASLLDDPELLFRIARAVRAAVPAHQVVSAKMRLGVNDSALSVACAQALADGGVSEIVVHARTKADAYRPPAWWDRLVPIREAVSVPLVANGEIWTVDDALRCQAESGCDALMLGRGMVADPGLALAIRAAWGTGGIAPATPLPWASMLTLMARFSIQIESHVVPRHRAGRIKQWLNYLRRRYPEAQEAYARLRTQNDVRALCAELFAGLPEADRYTLYLSEHLLPHGRDFQGERDVDLRSEECCTDGAGAVAQDP